MLGVCALLGAALIVPAYAMALSILAVALSATMTAVAFYRHRRFYLEAKLREKKTSGLRRQASGAGSGTPEARGLRPEV